MYVLSYIISWPLDTNGGVLIVGCMATPGDGTGEAAGQSETTNSNTGIPEFQGGCPEDRRRILSSRRNLLKGLGGAGTALVGFSGMAVADDESESDNAPPIQVVQDNGTKTVLKNTVFGRNVGGDPIP